MIFADWLSAGFYVHRRRTPALFLHERCSGPRHHRAHLFSALSFAVVTVLMAGIDMFAFAVIFQSMLNWPFALSVWPSNTREVSLRSKHMLQAYQRGDSACADDASLPSVLRLKHNLQQSGGALIETLEPGSTILERSNGADERLNLNGAFRHERNALLVFAGRGA